MYKYIYILTQNKGCESFASQMKGEKWQNQYSKINSGCENLNFAKNVKCKIVKMQVYTFVDMKFEEKASSIDSLILYTSILLLSDILIQKYKKILRMLAKTDSSDT